MQCIVVSKLSVLRQFLMTRYRDPHPPVFTTTIHSYTNSDFLCLQDQYDNLAAHTHKGIEFLDKYGNFVKERCAIELEYAGKLR